MPQVETLSEHPPKNFLFIILDAFAAEYVSHLGYPEKITPILDGIAAEGATFSQAHSQTSVTGTSVKSYLTGRYPGRPSNKHKIAIIRPEEHSVAKSFQAAGFRTGGFSESSFISPNLGFAQGFDTFEMDSPLQEEKGDLKYFLRDHASTLRLATAAREWITTGDSMTGWFCYLHLVRPHNPYTVPESFWRQPRAYTGAFDINLREIDLILGLGLKDPEEVEILKDRYAANIAYVDFVVGELLDGLAEDGTLDDTLVVIASDHGEAFNQHGKFGHVFTAYEEMTRVPLIMRFPPDLGLSPSQIDSPVEMVDLYPTLLELYSLESPHPAEGKSLLPLLTGETREHKDVLFTLANYGNLLAVRRMDQKLMFHNLPDEEKPKFVALELFDLNTDPGEQVNLLTTEVAIDEFSALAELYLANFYDRGSATAPTLTDDERERLHSLGYLNN